MTVPNLSGRADGIWRSLRLRAVGSVNRLALTRRLSVRIFIVDTLEVIMKTRVQKWANSLALRIPKTFAEEAGFRAEAAVELSLVEGAFVVHRITPEPLTLDQLLLGVTDDNLPSDWDIGPAVGKELC
jgi:antitoxin MazE